MNKERKTYRCLLAVTDNIPFYPGLHHDNTDQTEGATYFPMARESRACARTNFPGDFRNFSSARKDFSVARGFRASARKNFSDDFRDFSSARKDFSDDFTNFSPDSRVVSGDSCFDSGDSRDDSGDSRDDSGDSYFDSGDSRDDPGDSSFVSGDFSFVSPGFKDVSCDFTVGFSARKNHSCALEVIFGAYRQGLKYKNYKTVH